MDKKIKMSIYDYNPFQATVIPSQDELKPYLKNLNEAWISQELIPIIEKCFSSEEERKEIRVEANDYQNIIWHDFFDRVLCYEEQWQDARIESDLWRVMWDYKRATAGSYIKERENLPIKHWFFDFLKLGVIVIFDGDRIRIYGKDAEYIGEYNIKDFDL